MCIAEGAVSLVAKFAFVGRIRRDPDMQGMPAASLQGAELRQRESPVS